MAKKNLLMKSIMILFWAVGIIGSIAIGGLFINGTFTSTVILNWLPLIAHKVVGWTIIVSTILGAIVHWMKK